MKMIRYHKIMEKFWLVMAVATLLFAVYHIGNVGLSEGYVYLFMPLVAAILYVMRRYMRKRLENAEERKNTEEGNE